MKQVLVTGGAGFIGLNLVRQLIALGYSVTILDNFNHQIHGYNKTISPGLLGKVRLIVGDVTDKELLFDSLDNADAVIHLAAETGTGQSMYSISNYTKVNILGTSYLCDYLVNSKHSISTVIVASSRALYGEGKYFSPKFGTVYPNARTRESILRSFNVLCPFSGENNLEVCPTDENSKIHPSSIYGITKQVQEQMIIMACKIAQINGYALRYQNVFGPGQSLKNPYTGILSIFSRLALNNETINIFEDGLESRDFVFIDDAVDATIRCLEAEIRGQYIFNVGSGKAVPIIEVAKEIVCFLGSSSKIYVSGQFREGDIRHNIADLSFIKETIGYIPKTRFVDGLKEFLRWVTSQSDIPNDANDYFKSIQELKDRGLITI